MLRVLPSSSRCRHRRRAVVIAVAVPLLSCCRRRERVGFSRRGERNASFIFPPVFRRVLSGGTSETRTISSSCGVSAVCVRFHVHAFAQCPDYRCHLLFLTSTTSGDRLV